MFSPQPSENARSSQDTPSSLSVKMYRAILAEMNSDDSRGCYKTGEPCKSAPCGCAARIAITLAAMIENAAKSEERTSALKDGEAED